MRVLMLIVILAISGVSIAQDAVVETPVDGTSALEAKVAVESDVAEEAEAMADSGAATEAPAIDAYAEAEDIMLHLCMECHGDYGYDAGFKLPTTREGAGMAGVPSIQRSDLMLIDLENPESSYLIMKLRDDKGILGKRMPIARLLSEEQLSMFDLWVGEISAAYVAGLEPGETDAGNGDDGDGDDEGAHGDDEGVHGDDERE